MSVHDERLVEGSQIVRGAVRDLEVALLREKQAKIAKKVQVDCLLRLGLSSRFVAKKAGVSHVTVLAWSEEVRPQRSG